jgi:uncharacterized protein (TIGR02145 family)
MISKMRLLRKSEAMFCFALSFFSQACIEKPTPPVVVTIPVIEISYASAASGGAVTNEGRAPVTGRGVCWNTSVNPDVTNNKTEESGGFGAFTSSMTQLSGGTVYYVRAYAKNEAGTGYGNQLTFTTRQSLRAELSTAEVTAITQNSAISGGNITNDFGGLVTVRGLCWSTTTGPTIELTTKTTDGTGSGLFISNMTNLTPGTLYYIRAYATNISGTSYGNELTFTTSRVTTPVLTTSAVTSATTSSAVSGGNITNDNGGIIMSRGICWSTSAEPTVALNTKTIDGTGSGSFISNLNGLQPGLTYYVRAYATNNSGTAYGNQIIFNTKIADADGNTYNIVLIGTQYWMAENLKTTKFIDKTEIPLVSDNSAWIALFSPGYCLYNNDEILYKKVYGALYNWYALDSTSNGGKNVCPAGWHIPSYTEWNTMLTFLGGTSVAGDKLKEKGTVNWPAPNTAATNESGFTALPGGIRSWSGGYASFGSMGYWWSATMPVGQGVFHIYLSSGTSSVSWQNNSAQHAFSVRCIRDF